MEDFHQMDVKLAFFNGYLEKDIYVEKPQAYMVKGDEDKVLKLKKALYRLKKVPKSQNCKIGNYFQENGFQKYAYECALYLKVITLK